MRRKMEPGEIVRRRLLKLNAPAREVQMSLGELVLKRRKELGLTLEEVADAAGVTIPYVVIIQQDKRVPTMPVLLALARVLKFDPMELVFAGYPMLRQAVSWDVEVL